MRVHHRSRGRAAILLILLMPVLLIGCGSSEDRAQESTLDKVTKSKVLKIGTLSDVPPFAVYDQANQLVGYDVELAKLIAADLGAKPEFVVLPNAPARISALISGQVDMVAAAFTVTPERAQSIAFTTPTAPNPAVILARKDQPDIQTLEDLKGRRVSLTTGSTGEIVVALQPDAEYVRYQDQAATYQALYSGQVDATTTALAAAQTIVKEHPELEIRGEAYLTFNAIGIRRNDPEWLNWLNTTIVYHGGRGELGVLWEEWVGGEMPPTLPDF